MTQVATGATITLSQTTGLTTFSPDSNFVYLRRQNAREYPQGALFVIPALGSGEEPRRILTDILGNVALSPKGDRIAFVRMFIPPQGAPDVQVMIANVDGSEPRVLHSGRIGISWAQPSSLSWSPDGRVIAAAYLSRDNGLLMSPMIIDVETGKLQRLTDVRWSVVARTAWLRDGSALVVSGLEPGATQGQIWLVSRRDGQVKRITNDLHHYAGGSVDVDAHGTIVARQQVSKANVWIADAQGNGLQRLTRGSGSDTVVGWIDAGRVLYLTDTPDRSLWSVPLDGGAPKRLPLEARAMGAIAVATGQNWLAFMSEPVPNIWRVNLDGTGRQQLTHTGFDRMPKVVAGGGEILYENWSEAMPTVWRVPSGGGQPVRLAERVGIATPSPDGQRFWGLIGAARRGMAPEGDSAFVKLGIFRLSDGSLERTVDHSDLRAWINNQLGQWSPDGHSVIYRRSPGGISNLWSLPLSGGEPQQFTRFESDWIFSLAYSPDGQRMAMSRGSSTGDIVLIRNYR
jgi:Tol biopolymer transport system component